MLTCMDYSKHYKHEMFFEFKGKKYSTHSIVKLTDKARSYFGSARNEVTLTEIYYDFRNRLCFKYEFKSIALNVGIINKSTDKLPDELIEEVVYEPGLAYASRATFGRSSPFYNLPPPTKHSKKDWEIPEVLSGWVIFLLICGAVSIFQDFGFKVFLRGLALHVFRNYRKAYIDANTIYSHDEDIEIIEKKYEILYGRKPIKEDNEK